MVISGHRVDAVLLNLEIFDTAYESRPRTALRSLLALFAKKILGLSMPPRQDWTSGQILLKRTRGELMAGRLGGDHGSVDHENMNII